DTELLIKGGPVVQFAACGLGLEADVAVEGGGFELAALMGGTRGLDVTLVAGAQRQRDAQAEADDRLVGKPIGRILRALRSGEKGGLNVVAAARFLKGDAVARGFRVEHGRLKVRPAGWIGRTWRLCGIGERAVDVQRG